MDKYTTLDSIDKFIYEWLTDYKNKYGFGKHNGFVKANQNAPAPQLPYGTWYVRELKKIGHRDQLQSNFDHIYGVMTVDDLSFFTFTVEITSFGYGSNQLLLMLSQAFDTDNFYFRADEAGIGYQSHGSSQDISAVADAEVREARQFTVDFNCVMRLRDTAIAIEVVEVTNDIDNTTIIIDSTKTIVIVNNGNTIVNNGFLVVN